MNTARRHTLTVDPFGSFRDEHLELLRRLDVLEVALPAAIGPECLPSRAVTELRATIAHLEHQFATHMAFEERVLFPQLVAAFPESAVTLLPLNAEHAELRSMRLGLAELLAMPECPARDEQLRVQSHDLIDLLRIHIAREETVAFMVAERVLRPREWRALARCIVSYRATGDRQVPNRSPRKKGCPG